MEDPKKESKSSHGNFSWEVFLARMSHNSMCFIMFELIMVYVQEVNCQMPSIIRAVCRWYRL